MNKDQFFEIKSSVFNLEKMLQNLLKNADETAMMEIEGCTPKNAVEMTLLEVEGCKSMLNCLKQMKENFDIFAK